MNDLLRQVAELRTDLRALDRRVRSLADAFDMVEPAADDDTGEATCGRSSTASATPIWI
ncbi:hypothetical protein [Rhodococcus ruber]|uniref:hypothetical protein n=1 Tax=Rhodococcus TaxID=1827 RepID=UPI001EE4D3FE|nr:hypothetical protein [Rhodococcus ruber]